MNIAFFGASSQIAKGLIKKFAKQKTNKLFFFVRDRQLFSEWISNQEFYFDNSQIKLYDDLSEDFHVDLFINCIGSGDPAKTKNMGSTIIPITQKYDEQIISYLNFHPDAKYIYLSSGVAYGDVFSSPPDTYTSVNFDIKSSKSEDMYTISKIKTELAHRSQPQFSIIDIRIFSYFDSEVSIDNRFFLTDALRSIQAKKIFLTNKHNMTRDYIGSDDLFQLISKLASINKLNTVVDAYSLAPIDKFSILDILHRNYNFEYEFVDSPVGLNATGIKDHYYSKNYCAKDYGYQPSLSSKDVILNTANSLLSL